MEISAWVVVVLVIAVVFIAISGEVLVTLVLTALWAGTIWLVATHGAAVIEAVWPAILIVLAMVILSVATLASLASALEDRRSRKDERTRGVRPRRPLDRR